MTQDIHPWRMSLNAWAAGNWLVECLLGPSRREAKSTAQQAAKGRRAYQRWRVEGWPWRLDFSRAEAAVMAWSGRPISISFLRGVGMVRPS